MASAIGPRCVGREDDTDADPSAIVIDEVAGMWLVMAFVPTTLPPSPPRFSFPAVRRFETVAGKLGRQKPERCPRHYAG